MRLRPPLLLPLPHASHPPLPPLPHLRHSSSSRSTSSKIWLQRQGSDPFVKARADAFVSRSAFKLQELQAKSRNTLLRPGMTVVDLGASPGGWVQAAAECLNSSSSRRAPQSRIIAVDLLPLHPSVVPLPDLTFIKGDFLDPLTQQKVHDALSTSSSKEQDNKVDLVLSDMLANLSGTPGRDAQLSLDLCLAALAFAVDHLRPSLPNLPSPTTTPLPPNTKGDPPSLVIKFLQSDLTPVLAAKLRRYFASVRWDKPKSSRAESREGYWVCSGFRGKDAGEVEAKRDEVAAKEEEDSIFF